MVKIVTGRAAGYPQPNVDTDVIMPKRFLKTITREGLAEGAFADLRFDEEGNERTDFVLNQPHWRSATILVVGDNFGCGSSREHAVWGLMQLGVQAIIGTDFGGIFYDNARKNGLVLAVVEPEMRDELMICAQDINTYEFSVDVASKIITAQSRTYAFDMDDATRSSLLLGKDETLDTMMLSDQIKAFEQQHHQQIKVTVNK